MLLWADMIGTRTYIKFLRHLGIALILAPDPVTTPFGVACILAARHLSRRLEASRNSHLREMVRYYLAHTHGFSDYADGTFSAQGPIKRHGLKDEHAILGQITGSRSFAANTAPLIQQSECDIQGGAIHHARDMQSLSRHRKAGNSFSDTSARTEKMIYHTIDMESLSLRYEGEGSTVAHSGWVHASGVGEAATYHYINMQSLARRYPTADIRQTELKYRTTNMALLRQRHGSAVNYTTALRALRNNNYYYDVSSRGNVVGGY